MGQELRSLPPLQSEVVVHSFCDSELNCMLFAQRVEQGGGTQVSRSLKERENSLHSSVTLKMECEEDSRRRLACKQHRLPMRRMVNLMARRLR